MGNIFIGANGNKKIKNAWIGTSQGSKKVKAIWIGTPQGNRKIWTSAFAFTYTGEYEVTGSLDGDFCITFLSSGLLTITSLGKAEVGVDLFCVAGGYAGSKAQYYGWVVSSTEQYYHGQGGHGGAGGACVTEKGKTVTETTYQVAVGDAGGNVSSFGSLASATGAGASGGKGGDEDMDNKAATAGSDGTYAFGESNFVTFYPVGTKFGAGGGGGHGWYNYTDFPAKVGGTSGGGAGGTGGTNPTVPTTAGGNATIPGSGGGGGAAPGGVINNQEAAELCRDGGAGMNGVVMLRNKR